MSTEDREEKAKSQKIDRDLEEYQRKLKRECKILLLGTHTNKQQTKKKRKTHTR